MGRALFFARGRGLLVIALTLAGAAPAVAGSASHSAADPARIIPRVLERLHLDEAINRLDLTGSGRTDDVIVKATEDSSVVSAATNYLVLIARTATRAVVVGAPAVYAGYDSTDIFDTQSMNCFVINNRFFAATGNGKRQVYLVRAIRNGSAKQDKTRVELLHLERMPVGAPGSDAFRFRLIKRTRWHRNICDDDLDRAEQRLLHTKFTG